MPRAAPPPFPLVPLPFEPRALAAAFEDGYPWEFCACESFEPGLVAGLAREGFIPMATDWPGGDLLTPKLHLLRACLEPAKARATRSTLRAARGLELRAGTAFEEVLEACLAAHGDGWLRPPLVGAFRALALAGPVGDSGLLSFELYRGESLVAGEFGFLAGACYTSFSGFRREDGAGSVQLAATASALARAGVRLWDLGMPMAYKTALGAAELDRADFLRAFRAARDLGDRPDFSFLPAEAVGLAAALGRAPPQ